ncbi:MAG TPA: NAD-dependent epimerase/dehydratase family protein [Thermoanaerobaculia bacterium]|nr:NAD-dependent epimerase/dehydratase family protein [Thermoanaerobaculia bacterium]
MSRRVYLTGATGYIGQPLALRLAAAGHEVRALVRASSDPARVASLVDGGVACFPGDLADRASLREGMSGADWVVHAAAELDPAAPAERMREANVAGAENVASLASKLGTGRFLLLSSIAAFAGSPDDGTPASEETPRRPDPPSLYSATKRAGEDAVRAWAARGGLRLNVVWPSLVYGPPGKKRGTNALLRRYAKGRVPVVVGADRRSSWIYLEDLIEGLLRVIERAPAGRDFLMTGDVATVGSVVRRVVALAGVRPPRWSLPVPVAKAALALATPYYRLRGWRPPASADQLDSLARHWAFDDARARRELDWRPRTLDEGLPETIRHLVAA